MGLAEIFSRKSARLEKSIEGLMETVDQSLLVFKEGVKNYLYGDEESFAENLAALDAGTAADFSGKTLQTIFQTPTN